jgi:3-methyladenine DNA glycosylase AlkD
MPVTQRKPRPKRTSTARPSPPAQPLSEQVAAVLASLRKLASNRIRDEMGPRYGVFTDKAWGVAMRDMQAVAKKAGKSHQLALALWDTGWYEARMVACMVDEPDKVTPAQMDRWCKDFDNWGICDTVCFKLFDQVAPDLAFARVHKWARSKEEFVKRGAFALLGCLALHNKLASDEQFLQCMPLIEHAAQDDRNFVKKGVSWGFRGVGRRSPAVYAAALSLARRLVASPAGSARWIGKQALGELEQPALARKLGRK